MAPHATIPQRAPPPRSPASDSLQREDRPDDTRLMPEAMNRSLTDDPRQLRELLARTQQLAADHDLPSVVVGFAAPEGDRMFPDFVSYVESELRVEDAVFRMTRERAVLVLSDVPRDDAQSIVERLVEGFRGEAATLRELPVHVRYFEVEPGADELTVKRVLPAVFTD